MAPPATLVRLPVFLAAFVLSVGTHPALARSSSCPDGWQISPVQNKCFKYVSTSLSWDRSEALCRNYSGHLAALSSVQELIFAKSLCGSLTSGCWVGGHHNNTSAGNGWKWSDDSSLWNETAFPVELLHSNCSGTACGVATSNDLCTLVVNGHVSISGKRCSEPHGLICMMDRGRCYHDRCHKVYFIALIAVSGFILATTLAVVVWLLVYMRSKKRRSREALGASSAALVAPQWKVCTNFSKESMHQ